MKYLASYLNCQLFGLPDRAKRNLHRLTYFMRASLCLKDEGMADNYDGVHTSSPTCNNPSGSVCT